MDKGKIIVVSLIISLAIVSITVWFNPFYAIAGIDDLSISKDDRPKTESFIQLLNRVDEKEKVPVIVDFDMDFKTRETADEQVLLQQRVEIAMISQGILQAHVDKNFEYVRVYENIPHLSLVTDREGLIALWNDPRVRNIQEDIPAEPHMDVSTELIGAVDAWNAGYTGEGTVVAVLDTGIDVNHPYFDGIIVNEACFSSALNTGDQSLCPNGEATQFGPGSAIDCDTSISGCGHGTHVSGSVSGSGTSNGRELSGVAPEAGIIAIQVFTHRPQSECDSGATTDCVRSYVSDQIAALDWLYSIRNDHNIVAANMSLGGGRFYDEVSCDASNIARKNAVDLLRTVNIATISSSGNRGYKDSMGSPACISTVISVGSSQTNKIPNPYSGCCTNDAPSDFSNSASFLDLMAPGELIESAEPDNDYGFRAGTSMAAPHVAGAWAIFHERFPDSSVETVLDQLTNTGVPITDINGVTTPRIQVDAAIGTIPEISVNPEFFNLSVEEGGSTSVTLTIFNDGDTILDVFLSDVSGSPVLTKKPLSQKNIDKDYLAKSGKNGIAVSIEMENTPTGTASFSCDDKIEPLNWPLRSGTTVYTWGPGNGHVFGINVFDDQAAAQVFDIIEDISLDGMQVLIGSKNGTTGNVLFTVWDEATKSILHQESVSMNDIPNGASTFTIEFDETLEISDNFMLGASFGELGSYTEDAYTFGMVSSADGDANNAGTAIVLESNDQWVPVLAYNLDVEIGIFGCLSDEQPTQWLSYSPTQTSIAPSSNAIISIDIDASELDTGIYERTLRIASNDPSNSLLQIPVTLEVTEPGSAVVQQSYEQHWNLVGLPVDQAHTNYQEIFPTAQDNSLYSFDTTYNLESTLEPGIGYWLYFESADDVDFSGDQLPEVFINVDEDWNLITGTSNGSVINDPEEILLSGTLYSFDGSYNSAVELEPGKGFWVAASESGQISVGDPTAASTLLADNALLSLKETGDLNLSFFANEKKVSRLVMTSEDLSQFHPLQTMLPPLPPSDLPDVRFEGDYWVTEQETAIVNLQGKTDYSLELSGEKGLRIELISGQSVVDVQNLIPGERLLIQEEISALGVSLMDSDPLSDLPNQFVVHPNYPNPFNPTTTLRYELPDKAQVSIEVYNITGQRIVQLVNESQSAGYHSVVFDAGTLSSGVYLYRFNAKSTNQTFTKTGKMMLIK